MTPKGFLVDVGNSCYTVFSGHLRNITNMDDTHQEIVLGQEFFSYIYTTLDFEDEKVTFNVKKLEGGNENHHVMIIPTLSREEYLTMFFLFIATLGFIVLLCLWGLRYRRIKQSRRPSVQIVKTNTQRLRMDSALSIGVSDELLQNEYNDQVAPLPPAATLRTGPVFGVLNTNDYSIKSSTIDANNLSYGNAQSIEE